MRVRVDSFNAGFASSHVPELDRTVIAAGHQVPAKADGGKAMCHCNKSVARLGAET